MSEALANLPPALVEAIWAGDVDTLSDLAPCACCCAEHTHGSSCPAYAWGGCRGQGSEDQDIDGWARHYGMTRNEFLGAPEFDQLEDFAQARSTP